MSNTPPLLWIAQMQIIASAVVAGDGQAAGSSLPRFSMVAYTGGPMRVAGWRYPVVVDLAGLQIPSAHRPIRFGHDASSGVGHTDAIKVENGQLIAGGVVSRDTPAAKEIITSSKNGFPWQASIGTSVDEFEFIKEGQSVQVNGKSFSGPINVIRKATLGEISFVDLGADGNTSAKVAASAPDQETPMPNHQATPPVTAVATLETPAKTPPAADPAQAAEAIRIAAVTETNRITAIRHVCGGKYAEIEALAIRDSWDANRTELEVLRASRPKAPAVMVRAEDPGLTNSVLEAACYMSARLDGVEKMFDEQVLEAAERRFHRAIGLQEMLLEAAWANGYTGRTFRDTKAVMHYAFLQAAGGMSTIDIGGILSNVTNKFLLAGFSSVENTWRNICAVRNVSDFKTVTSYRLIGTDQYEQVAPGGELKHGTLGNEMYSNKADTYGLTLTIDRRDIINDDIGAITTVPRKLGRGSGLKINDVFWTDFLNNSAFFTAGARNYMSGADTVLSIDGLTKAEVAFLDQVDSDGKPIGMMPAILLVPTALSAMGSQLYKSLELRDTTANTKFPVANPHQGKFRVEVSRYLANSRYAGASAKSWYLLADPNDLPVIEVAFLNGNESPTIETSEANFNQLGISLRGYHDFGVALQDPRGGIKSKGEA